MSGINMALGDTTQLVNNEQVEVEFPEIVGKDRPLVEASLYFAGLERGALDGRQARSRPRVPPVDPVPASFLKLHLQAVLAGMGPKIAAAKVPAEQAVERWLSGYKCGFTATCAE